MLVKKCFLQSSLSLCQEKIIMTIKRKEKEHVE